MKSQSEFVEIVNIEITALDIVNKAMELGFDKCGIIPVQMMNDYEMRLEERMEHFHQTRDKYEPFRSFAHLQNDYPWAKAIVVVSFWYYCVTMGRNAGVSCLTTWDGWNLMEEPLRDKFGKWIYGCDDCQDACPYNRNAWKNTEQFPELEEWEKDFTYAKIVLSDYNWLQSVIQPKLWYIPKGKEWRYKTNALNAMLNNYDPEYLPVIQKACFDEYAEVRDMAKCVLDVIENGNMNK